MELLKRSKNCTRITLALFWQYINLFRGAALTSGFPHVHLFFVPVLAEKEFPYCNTILAGASGSSYLPDATKLWYDEGWVVWSTICTCYMDMMKVMFKHWSRGFLSLVFVSSCWCLLIEDGTYIIIMNLAQNVLSVLYKCVSCGGCPTRCHRARASTLSNPCPGESMIGRN